jgi:hypothetical protein
MIASRHSAHGNAKGESGGGLSVIVCFRRLGLEHRNSKRCCAYRNNEFPH